jgi:hypothetical protein
MDSTPQYSNKKNQISMTSNEMSCARMEETRNVSKILDDETEMQRLFGRSGSRWESNIKFHLKKEDVRV